MPKRKYSAVHETVCGLTYADCLDLVGEGARPVHCAKEALPPCSTISSRLLDGLGKCVVCWDSTPLHFYLHSRDSAHPRCWRHPLIGCVWCVECHPPSASARHALCQDCACRIHDAQKHHNYMHAPQGVVRYISTGFVGSTEYCKDLTRESYLDLFGMLWWVLGKQRSPEVPLKSPVVESPYSFAASTSAEMIGCPVCRCSMGIPTCCTPHTVLPSIGERVVMLTMLANFGPWVYDRLPEWIGAEAMESIQLPVVRQLQKLPLKHTDCYDIYCPHRFDDWCHIVDWFLPLHLRVHDPPRLAQLVQLKARCSPLQYTQQIQQATRSMLGVFAVDDVRVQLVNIAHARELAGITGNPHTVNQARAAQERIILRLGRNPCPWSPATDPAPDGEGGGVAADHEDFWRLLQPHARCAVLRLRYGQMYRAHTS